MSAQGPQYHGTKKKIGEEGRFRENTAAQTPLPTRGQMFTRPLPGGRSLEPRKQRVISTTHPFKVTAIGDGFRVEPGTFGGTIPTLGGIPLSSDPVGELAGSESFVYLKVTFDIETEDNYVFAGTLNAAEIEVMETEEVDPLGPKGPGATAIFYILLATFEGSAKTGQYIINSLSYELCAVADDSGTVNLVVLSS
jgi:hypothetical protein